MNPILLAVGAGAFLWWSSRRRPQRRVNPSAKRIPRADPSCDHDKHDLERAKALSIEFHGNDRHVLVLDHAERHLPRYVVEAGALDDFAYEPGRGSKRDDAIYEHESGDRGLLAPKAKERPILAVNPRTRKPVLIPNRSPMKLTDRGFVG